MFVGFRVRRTTFHSKSQRGSTTGTQHKRWLKCTHCSRANMAPSLHPNFIRHLEKAECPVQNKATSPDSTGKGKLGSPNPFKIRFLFDFLFFLLSRFPRRNVHSGSMLVFGFLWHMRVHGMQMGHQFRFNPKRSKWFIFSFSSCKAKLGSSNKSTEISVSSAIGKQWWLAWKFWMSPQWQLAGFYIDMKSAQKVSKNVQIPQHQHGTLSRSGILT